MKYNLFAVVIFTHFISNNGFASGFIEPRLSLEHRGVYVLKDRLPASQLGSTRNALQHQDAPIEADVTVGLYQVNAFLLRDRAQQMTNLLRRIFRSQEAQKFFQLNPNTSIEVVRIYPHTKEIILRLSNVAPQLIDTFKQELIIFMRQRPEVKFIGAARQISIQ